MFNCPLYSWGNCLYDLPFISNVLVWNGGWSFRYWLSFPGRNVLSTLMTPLNIYYRCSITSGLKWLDREALAKTICPTVQLWCNFLCISLHWQPLKVRVIFSCCYNGKHFSMTPLHIESECFLFGYNPTVLTSMVQHYLGNIEKAARRDTCMSEH